MKRSTWGGLFRLHGQDIARLQRLLDPLVLTLLFLGLESGGRWVGSDGLLPFWVLVPLTALLIFSRAGLYALRVCGETPSLREVRGPPGPRPAT